MINILTSSYFSSKKDDDFFESCRTWAMLGLNWMQLLRNTQMERKSKSYYRAQMCELFLQIIYNRSSYHFSGSCHNMLHHICLAVSSSQRISRFRLDFGKNCYNLLVENVNFTYLGTFLIPQNHVCTKQNQKKYVG